jgi:glycerol-3-phosphate dehydrogenase
VALMARRTPSGSVGTAAARTPQSAPFSPAARTLALDALRREAFDVLVVGGGITGAGIARDAAMRGLRVALVEREDFGAGTSSRSSRLVHGGLRYLEHGHLGLVFEASRERRVLARIAPHLVRPLAFTWPLYENARIPRWKLRAGLLLYDALSLFRNLGRHRALDHDAVAHLEPELRQHGLVGGAVYFDAATDDARLTLANARAAAESGAAVVNHAEVRELVADAGGAVRGAVITDTLGGEEVRARAHVVVNATGPWSDAIVRLAARPALPSVVGSRGAHIAVHRERIGNRGALTLLSPIDGRVIFVLPAGDLTIVGTTESVHEGPPEEARATTAEIKYLLRSANAFFPAAHLGLPDVVSAWAGVRPLAAGTVNGDAGRASREHAITLTAPGLITVSGGKLTTYRAMAAEAVDAAARAIGMRAPRAPTDQVALPGGDIDSLDDEVIAARVELGSGTLALHLAGRYGRDWREVWSLVRQDPALGEPLVPGRPDLAAEVAHAVEREMAMTIADVLVRRLHLAYEARDHALDLAPRVAELMAPRLGWSPERTAAELARYEGDVGRMFGVEAE